jgi:predicted Zn-dependent protease
MSVKLLTKASRLVVLSTFLASSSAAEKLHGYIWDVQGSTVVVEGVEVHLLPTTRIERLNHPDIRRTGLRIGWEVAVEGESKGKELWASKLEVKTERFKALRVDDLVEAIGEGSAEVGGRTLHWPQGFKEAATAGMHIRGTGKLLDDGSIQLEKVELKPAGLERGERDFLTLASHEIEELKEKLVFYDDPSLLEYVNRVGQSLVPDWAEAEPVRFSFPIVDDPDINAFAMPDGTVVVHTGLLAALENEAQLASVLGHEIAHITHKHSYRGYRRAQRMQWLALSAAVAGAHMEQSQGTDSEGDAALGRILLEVGATLALDAVINGHGRNQEDAADRIGLHYAFGGGYDPFQAPEVWQLFNEHLRDQQAVTNWLFSDHSTHQARISNLTREINLKYRGKVDPSSLNRNRERYSHEVRGARRHNAIADYERKETTNAQEAFVRLIEEDPSDAVSHFYLGNIHGDQRGPLGVERAIEEYEAALGAAPGFADPYRELGLLYYRQGDLRRAAELFETYIELAPEAADVPDVHEYLREIRR